MPPKCWLFDKPTETLFLNPGTYNLNKKSIIGEVIPLDAVDAEIAKRLQLGTHRDKQIMDLYLNILANYMMQNYHIVKQLNLNLITQRHIPIWESY